MLRVKPVIVCSNNNQEKKRFVNKKVKKFLLNNIKLDLQHIKTKIDTLEAIIDKETSESEKESIHPDDF